MSSNSNRGGARPGAGRPRKPETIEIPVKQDVKWIVVGISESFWQEFCEASSSTLKPLGNELQESDYMRFADTVAVEALDRYVRRNKRAEKKRAKE